MECHKNYNVVVALSFAIQVHKKNRNSLASHYSPRQSHHPIPSISIMTAWQHSTATISLFYSHFITIVALAIVLFSQRRYRTIVYCTHCIIKEKCHPAKNQTQTNHHIITDVIAIMVYFYKINVLSSSTFHNAHKNILLQFAILE